MAPRGQSHQLSETVWAVKGPVRIRKAELDGETCWIAEDAEGVAAMAPTRELLLQVLHDDDPPAMPRE